MNVLPWKCFFFFLCLHLKKVATFGRITYSSFTPALKNNLNLTDQIILQIFIPDQTRVKTSRITGVNGGFHLSWSVSPVASCGYILDWCPTLGDGPFEWLKVTPQETEARIISGMFSFCFNSINSDLRVYSDVSAPQDTSATDWDTLCPYLPAHLEHRYCWRDGRVTFVRKVRETVEVTVMSYKSPSLRMDFEICAWFCTLAELPDNLFAHHKWKQQDMSVVVSWDPVRLTEQSAFINGYVLYWSNQDSNVVYNVSTGMVASGAIPW